MKLSFIIIAYNEERSIGNAITSILAQNDLPKDFEIIVVNDGSRDNTLKVAQEYAAKHAQIRIVDLQPNRGRGAARAAGVAASKAELVAYIDADHIIPPHWLGTCMQYMTEFDACAGTAVPDGDITWIYNNFAMPTKVAPQATSITGSNNLIKRKVFSKVMFRDNKKDGEDVDLVHQMEAANFRLSRVDGLIVEHHETKNYLTSFHWLYQSGIGATKQWFEHKVVRIPDLSFFGFLGLCLLGAIAIVSSSFSLLVLLLAVAVIYGYVALVSALHLHGKFVLKAAPLTSIGAIIANSSFIFAYFCGRFTGLFMLRRAKAEVPSHV
jgi:glycosyltransferase involved in cell wall biosynthesis